MKWLLILLMPITIFAQRNEDTTEQNIYIYKKIHTKKNKEIWIYGGYDKYYFEDIGIGLTIFISNKKRKKK
jgi:hypothetical protein